MCVGTDLGYWRHGETEHILQRASQKPRVKSSHIHPWEETTEIWCGFKGWSDHSLLHWCWTHLHSSKVFFALLTSHQCLESENTATALQFYLVLMKLRLGLTHKDLAFRFHCSCATISTIFHEWLNIMAQRFTSLIHWPSREEIKNNIPALFRSPPFNSVRCICSEIFIDWPTSLSARAMTYSNYKSHNTINFLLGISPTGSITFLSKSWGGRAGDKTITKSSGLIYLLEGDDIFMADRGFSFPEYFGATKGVRLLIPASTRGKTQLSGQKVSVSRHMSRMRIHMERAIGRINKIL